MARKGQGRGEAPGRNGHAEPAEEEPEQFRLTSCAEVKAAKLRYLWRGRLAFGALVILEGRKGDGKSTLAAAVAAHVTGGPRLPGERSRGVGSVLWFPGEESVAVTTRPKLAAAGAKPQRVYFPGLDRTGVLVNRLCVPGDCLRLEAWIKETGAWLVVLDPLSSFVAPGLDLMNSQQARAVMESLQAVADRTGCVILVIRHLTKSCRGDARNAGMGSAEIGNVARCILRCDRHPDAEGEWVLSVVATNLCKEAPSLRYRLDDAGGMPRLAWQGECVLSADELADGSAEPGEADVRADARRFLQLELQRAPRDAKDLILRAGQNGVAPRTLYRAKRELGIVSVQKWDASARASVWQWVRPAKWPKLD